MAGYYIYLISSLPMLHFGAKPPFSFEKFISLCQGLIPEGEIDILNKIALAYEQVYEKRLPQAENIWRAFDTGLRNELVKIRAARKKVDPLKYIRAQGDSDPEIAHIALNAYRNPSLIEAEIILDRQRWQKLEDLAIGHYFDLDFLVVYAHKLLILQRWNQIHSADKQKELEEVLVSSK